MNDTQKIKEKMEKEKKDSKLPKSHRIYVEKCMKINVCTVCV